MNDEQLMPFQRLDMYVVAREMAVRVAHGQDSGCGASGSGGTR
jgi:hypothetical protein